MQIKMGLKEVEQEPPQHLNHADAGRNGDGPGLAQAVFAQQADHVGGQGSGDGHHQDDKQGQQQIGRAAQMRAQGIGGPDCGRFRRVQMACLA